LKLIQHRLLQVGGIVPLRELTSNSTAGYRCRIKLGEVAVQIRCAFTLGVIAGCLAATPVVAADEEKVLRAVMHSDLKILDPGWTTAYITRDYGYMVYDTLFALDENLEVQPQMVGKWSISADGLAYAFELRDGLTFHDGEPVTAEDVVASLRRWGQKDPMGQRLLTFVDELKASGPNSFVLTLKEPYGLVLASLARPSFYVPFIMPKRVAETPADQQIDDQTGSGPFMFKKDEWRPGAQAVFVRNPAYKARKEPPSWLAGGKIAKVDRVEWVWIPDQQTAMNALLGGEIDLIEAPAHDLLPVLETDPNIVAENTNPLGYQYWFRFNFLYPPFDNPKIRQAALAALSQLEFLKAGIGSADYYRECPAMLVCDTTYASEPGGEVMLRSDFELSRRLLAEAGYDGTPVIFLHATDIPVLNNAGYVVKQQLERGGFTVKLESMDWQTLVSRRARKGPPAAGGWNAFMTWVSAVDVFNPVGLGVLSGTCERAWFGWPCDPEMETLLDAFARATNLDQQRELAAQIQRHALQFGTHAWLGEWYQPMAWRKEISGVVESPVPVFWNITKE
jgi:peptide/nickel transport system substrate-binding protein